MFKKGVLILSVSVFCFSMVSCGKSAEEKALDEFNESMKQFEKEYDKSMKEFEKSMKDLGYYI